MVEHTLTEATDVVRNRIGDLAPRVGIVLGSGLGGLAAAVDDPVTIPYREIPGLPEPTVQGHQGELVAGRLAGTPVVLQRGRLHMYEGHAPELVAQPVRLLADLGIDFLIVTNAAGGIGPMMKPPTLMLIADQINLMFRSPLLGPAWEGEERFPDMSQPYSAELRALAGRVALDAGIELHVGVYAAVLGPSYETPAEIGMLRRMGASAVGMSTVPEVIVAQARGLEVLGISSITNPAAGTTNEPLNHEEVIEAGKAVARDLETILRGVVEAL